MEKSQAAKCLKFYSLQNNLFFRRTPEGILEDFDTVDFIMLLIHLAVNGGTEKLGGWLNGTRLVLGSISEQCLPQPSSALLQRKGWHSQAVPALHESCPPFPRSSIKCTSKLVWNGGCHSFVTCKWLSTGQILVKTSFNIQPWSHWFNTAVTHTQSRTLL